MSVTIAFSVGTDDGAPIVPATARWTLTDIAGNVINGREDVVIAVPESSNEIVLTDDDLVSHDDSDGYRRIVVNGTYATNDGESQPFSEEIEFSIEGRVN